MVQKLQEKQDILVRFWTCEDQIRKNERFGYIHTLKEDKYINRNRNIN